MNNYPSSLAEVTSSEGILYDPVESLVKIFGIGRALPGEPDKIITSMKPVFCGAPGLEGAPKDHKTGWDAAVGPPTRGLVNGNIGPNAATGNLAAKLIRPVRRKLNGELGTSMCSREELLRAI